MKCMSPYMERRELDELQVHNAAPNSWRYMDGPRPAPAPRVSTASLGCRNVVSMGRLVEETESIALHESRGMFRVHAVLSDVIKGGGWRGLE